MIQFLKYFFRRKKVIVSKIVILTACVTIFWLILVTDSSYKNESNLNLPSLNISTVELILNNEVCEKGAPIRLLILITSYIGHISIRKKVREEYPTSLLNSLGIRRLFLLVKPNPTRPTINYTLILLENSKHHDILLGDFQEHYHNLTYKHLMGLNWALHYCSRAQFVLKQDDDIWIDFHALISENEIQQHFETLNSSFSMFGNILQGSKVIRNPNSKWYVRNEEYENSIYPDFLSGWAYITTIKVITLLVEASTQVSFFWIDDAYITGILRTKIHSQPIHLINGKSYFSLHSNYTECCKTIIQKHLNSSHFYSCPFLFGPTVDQSTIHLINNHSQQCATYQKKCIRPQFTRKQLLLTCAIVQEPSPRLPNPNRQGKPFEVKLIKLSGFN